MNDFAKDMPRWFKGIGAAFLVSTVCAISVAIYFRYQILNGFSILSGDRYDQVIAISIFEHWRNTFLGISHWSQTEYLYPAKNTLGYNDGYFLYGAVYSIFRSFGVDPYLSGELVNVVTRAVGFLGFYGMVRRVFTFAKPWALLGATLFTISDNVFIQAGHTQLLSVSLAPVVAILIDGLVAAILRRNSAAILIWGLGAAAFYAAWLMTAFYMAWYCAFFAVFLAIAYMLIRGREAVTTIRIAVRGQLLPIGIVAAAFVLFNIPFLCVYVPKALETGMHSFAEVFSYTLMPLDIIRVGDGNILFGKIAGFIEANAPSGFMSGPEQQNGMPLILLFLFGCGVTWLWKNRRNLASGQEALLYATAAATVVTWVLAQRVGNVTLWWFVYHLFPGAQAARVVGRYQIFLTAPVIVIALSYLAHGAPKIAAPILGLVCVLLVLEQINTSPFLSLYRPLEVARLAFVQRPPPICRAFFVTGKRQGSLYPGMDGAYSHNVDAMIVAETMQIPTLNGMGTFLPPHWNLVDPEKSDYINRVKMYATLNLVVPGLCQLDLKSLTWTPKPFA